MADGWGKVPKIAEHMNLSSRKTRDCLKMGLRHVRLPTGTILIRYSWADEFLKQYEVTNNEINKIVDDVMKDF